MASKKVKTIIKEKLHVRKPIKSAVKAAAEAARIRKNEQSKLYRLQKKFDSTSKKGEADKLRKQIKLTRKVVDGLKTTVADIKVKASKIQKQNNEIKSLKLKNAAITRKLNKKYAGRQFDKEYRDLNNQHIKNTGLIQQKIQESAGLTYEINKNLGFEPEDIADNIDIDKRTLEKEFSDDFEDDYFDGEGGGGVSGGVDSDLEEEIIEDEIEVDEADGDGWVLVDQDVFWNMWKNFDNVEMQNINSNSYTTVTFQFGGSTFTFKGNSLGAIAMKAGETWREARVNGSDTIVSKYLSVDGTKLKYTID